jgi:phytoene/squalene synthetase
MQPNAHSDAELAAAITRAASRQTDLTIRYLVDKGRIEDAYRAYGYFRWVDDWIDQGARPRQERLAFIARQEYLVDACYRGDYITSSRCTPKACKEVSGGLAVQETILVNLIAADREPNSGLQAYIRNLLAVMAFDAERRERLVTAYELDQYTNQLALAVTEALHYFIGHSCASPKCEARYLAVSGAHITHMLRDTLEDAEAGYYNIPLEVLTVHQINPWDVSAPAYRAWVKERVQQARLCFKAGRAYLAQVESLRCRLAGFAYMHRFEVVLNSIEREGYLLRSRYPERKEAGHTVEMIGMAFWMALKVRKFPSYSSVFTPQVRS